MAQDIRKLHPEWFQATHSLSDKLFSHTGKVAGALGGAAVGLKLGAVGVATAGGAVAVPLAVPLAAVGLAAGAIYDAYK